MKSGLPGDPVQPPSARQNPSRDTVDDLPFKTLEEPAGARDISSRPAPPSSAEIRKLGPGRLSDILRTCLLFKGMPEAALLDVARQCDGFVAYQGQTLIEEGEVGDDMLLIISGRVGIHVESISPFVEVGISRLGPGEVVGEMVIAGDRERSATVVMIEPGELIRIPGGPLLKLCADQPEIGFLLMRNVSRILAERLRRMNRRMVSLMKRRAL